MPLGGIALSCLALGRIVRRGALTVGRKTAIAALTISLLFAAAAPTDWLVFRHLVRGEAQQFAGLWLEAVAHRSAQLAHQLSLDPRSRQPLDDRLADAYRRDSTLRHGLEKMFAEPAIQKLLDLGPQSKARYCETPAEGHEDGQTWVQLSYAVNYDVGQEQKTLFISLTVQRVSLPGQRADWQVLQVREGTRPTDWQG